MKRARARACQVSVIDNGIRFSSVPSLGRDPADFDRLSMYLEVRHGAQCVRRRGTRRYGANSEIAVKQAIRKERYPRRLTPFPYRFDNRTSGPHRGCRCAPIVASIGSVPSIRLTIRVTGGREYRALARGPRGSVALDPTHHSQGWTPLDKYLWTRRFSSSSSVRRRLMMSPMLRMPMRVSVS